MSFNISQYEYIYGFDLLDSMHNFFPELLYDESLFQNEIFSWIRHRVESLFPNVYARQMNSYRLYQSQRRHTQYNEWRNRNIPRIIVSSAMRSYGVGVTGPTTPEASAPAHTPAPLQTSTLTSSVHPIISNRYRITPLAFPSTRYNSMTGIDILDGLLGLSSLMPFEDVAVTPTSEQIAAGSTLHDGSTVRADAVCTICQDHGDASLSWRVLHCNHGFHTNCVDRWFQENTLCPVCRADIRNAHQE
jgi:hypothetical protein